MPEPTATSGRRSAGELAAGPGNVLFETWLVSRAATALIDEAIRPSGLDADEFAVYSVLAGGDGMTPTELAHWMAAPATTVSSYVKRFERRGHVRRVANPDDGRSYRVELTPAGRRAHMSAGEQFGPVLAAVNAGFAGGVEQVRRQLRDLHAVIGSLGRGT